MSVEKKEEDLGSSAVEQYKAFDQQLQELIEAGNRDLTAKKQTPVKLMTDDNYWDSHSQYASNQRIGETNANEQASRHKRPVEEAKSVSITKELQKRGICQVKRTQPSTINSTKNKDKNRSSSKECGFPAQIDERFLEEYSTADNYVSQGKQSIIPSPSIDPVNSGPEMILGYSSVKTSNYSKGPSDLFLYSSSNNRNKPLRESQQPLPSLDFYQNQLNHISSTLQYSSSILPATSYPLKSNNNNPSDKSLFYNPNNPSPLNPSPPQPISLFSSLTPSNPSFQPMQYKPNKPNKSPPPIKKPNAPLHIPPFPSSPDSLISIPIPHPLHTRLRLQGVKARDKPCYQIYRAKGGKNKIIGKGMDRQIEEEEIRLVGWQWRKLPKYIF